MVDNNLEPKRADSATPEEPRSPQRERLILPEKRSETEAHKETTPKEKPGGESDLKKLFSLPRLRKAPPTIPQVRDAVTLRVEKIMEEGIADAYARLSPVQQQEFKIKGEETAIKIRDLLRATHVKVKKVFQLILEWLRMLPGINRFFLEQEAKIKTDRITALDKQQTNK